MTDTTHTAAQGFNFDAFMYGVRRDSPFDGSTLADSISNDEVRRAESAFNSLLKRAEKAEAELAALKGNQVPVAWFTDDKEVDKSATTYSEDVARRWLAKGWPVGELFTTPQKPVVLPPFKPDEGYGGEAVRNWVRNETIRQCKAAIEAAGGIVKDGD